MEIKIETYKKVVDTSVSFDLPEETTYWFEYGIRRSIRIIPIIGKVLSFNGNEEKVIDGITHYKVTTVRTNSECKIEDFMVNVNEIADEIKMGKSDSVFHSMYQDWIHPRTEEEFQTDLKKAFNRINSLE